MARTHLRFRRLFPGAAPRRFPGLTGLVVGLLAGTEAHAASIAVRNALWSPPAFSVRMELLLHDDLIAAVEAHVALGFVLSVRCSKHVTDQHYSIDLSPLTKRYRVQDGGGLLREFSVRSEAIAALERISMEVPNCASALSYRYRLNLADLPPPLRVPALMQPQWQLDTGWRTLGVGAP